MDLHFKGAGRYDIYLHGNLGTEEVHGKLNFIIKQNEKMGQELDNLTQEVAETKTVQASAVALLKGLKKRLDEAGTDKVKLAALGADLDTSSNELAAAVTENTVAENEPPVEPPVTP